jgi:hypothetical protein
MQHREAVEAQRALATRPGDGRRVAREVLHAGSERAIRRDVVVSGCCARTRRWCRVRVGVWPDATAWDLDRGNQTKKQAHDDSSRSIRSGNDSSN